jgi:hypothetical protein
LGFCERALAAALLAAALDFGFAKTFAAAEAAFDEVTFFALELFPMEAPPLLIAQDRTFLCRVMDPHLCEHSEGSRRLMVATFGF